MVFSKCTKLRLSKFNPYLVKLVRATFFILIPHKPLQVFAVAFALIITAYIRLFLYKN